MRRVVFAPEAARDLEDIWDYVAEESAHAADRLLGRIRASTVKLAKNPGLGHTREDLVENRPVHFWPVGNYLILYRSVAGGIEVVGIVHGKRDIPAFLRLRDK